MRRIGKGGRSGWERRHGVQDWSAVTGERARTEKDHGHRGHNVAKKVVVLGKKEIPRNVAVTLLGLLERHQLDLAIDKATRYGIKSGDLNKLHQDLLNALREPEH